LKVEPIPKIILLVNIFSKMYQMAALYATSDAGHEFSLQLSSSWRPDRTAHPFQLPPEYKSNPPLLL